MRVTFSILFLAIFTTASVQSYCLFVKCKPRYVQVGDRCRRIRRRSVGDGNCVGSNRLLISDEILSHSGPLSIQCPEGYVFNGNMQCAVEGWEYDSGPWEVHHYTVRDRYLVFEMKQSSQSVRYRKLSIT